MNHLLLYSPSKLLLINELQKKYNMNVFLKTHAVFNGINEIPDHKIIPQRQKSKIFLGGRD